MQVGTSDDLRVGQTVFAIGNPSGLPHTLTTGVVSGLNRAIPSPGGTLTGGAIQVRPVPDPPACIGVSVGSSRARTCYASWPMPSSSCLVIAAFLKDCMYRFHL